MGKKIVLREPLTPIEHDALQELIEACQKLSQYRYRAGAVGFQLEKADQFIYDMRRALGALEDEA